MEQIADIELAVFEPMRRESWREGLEEGREEGEMLGRRSMLTRLLEHKFGEVPGTLLKKIEELTDDDVFDSLVEQALIAPTVEDLIFSQPLVDKETNAGSA